MVYLMWECGGIHNIFTSRFINAFHEVVDGTRLNKKTNKKKHDATMTKGCKTRRRVGSLDIFHIGKPDMARF